jgi:hypothetical protein
MTTGKTSEEASWTPTDTLTDWCVRRDNGGNPFLAPELCTPYLTGKSEKRGGKRVSTNTIDAVNGRLVRTKSGSVYRLGRIMPSYRAWMREQGWEYDPKQPIKMSGKRAA